MLPTFDAKRERGKRNCHFRVPSFGREKASKKKGHRDSPTAQDRKERPFSKDGRDSAVPFEKEKRRDERGKRKRSVAKKKVVPRKGKVKRPFS